MKIDANGISMAYDLSGEGDCLVLVHGAGDNRLMWWEQVPVLSRRFRLLTYDVRGFGESELPGGEVSMELLGEDLFQLLKALDIESACVLGYSMGGRIGLQAAMAHPEVVRALVLANSGVGATPPSPEAQERRKRFIGLLEQGDLETVVEDMTRLSFSPGLKERDPALFERYQATKLRNDPRRFARLWGALAAATPPDLKRLTCPVLIIAGERDSFMPLEAAKATHNAIPGSRFEVLPTGHAAAIEAPGEFNRIVIDFLAGLAHGS